MLISCPKCSTKISDKAHVCPHCGFQIDTPTKCPDCGQPVLPGSSACPSCGYPFSEETAQATAGPQAVTNTDANEGAGTNLHTHRPTAGNHVSRGTKRVWYYEVHGIVYGPKSADSIYSWFLNGQLSPSVNVWRPGSAHWAPAADYLLFSEEVANAEDVAEQNSLPESNELPPMVSSNGLTTYTYHSESPAPSPPEGEISPHCVPKSLIRSDETPVEKGNGGDGGTAAGGCLKGCLTFIIAVVVIYFLFFRGCGTTTNTPSNTPTTTTIDLQASVNFTGTQFVITNNDSFAWTSVEMQINYGVIADGFILTTTRVEAGTTYTVGAMQFAKADGTRFDPFTMKPQKFEIQADTPKGKGWYFGGWD